MVGSEWNDLRCRLCKALESLELIIPKAFKKYTEQPAIVRKNGAFLTGSVGSGKTTRAFCMAKTLVKQRKGYVTRVTVPELMANLKDFDRGSAKEKVGKLQHADILILDDLGAEKSSDFTYENLFEIINFRAENLKYTIITSNKALSELDDRIASRIVGLCELIKMNGEDLRLKNG